MDKFKITNELCEFYGILMGDGCVSKFKSQNRVHYAIRIDGHSITDKVYYYNHLKPLIEKIINRSVRPKFRKVGNCIFIMFEYKEFAIFLNDYFHFPFGKKGEIKINTKIINSKKRLVNTLRGLFDTDGCLYFTENNSEKRHYPIIEISTHSKSLLNQLKGIFTHMGFRVKISHFGDSIKLHGKENLIKWMEFIGTNHPDKLSKFKYWKRFGYCPKIDELSFDKRVKALKLGP